MPRPRLDATDRALLRISQRQPTCTDSDTCPGKTAAEIDGDHCPALLVCHGEPRPQMGHVCAGSFQRTVSQRDALRGTATQEVHRQTVRTGEGEHLTSFLSPRMCWTIGTRRPHGPCHRGNPLLFGCFPSLNFPPTLRQLVRRFPGVAGLV